jgi:hypothetical protein
MPRAVAGQIRAQVLGIDRAGLAGQATLGRWGHNQRRRMPTRSLHIASVPLRVTSRAGKKSGRWPVLGSNG